MAPDVIQPSPDVFGPTLPLKDTDQPVAPPVASELAPPALPDLIYVLPLVVAPDDDDGNVCV